MIFLTAVLACLLPGETSRFDKLVRSEAKLALPVVAVGVVAGLAVRAVLTARRVGSGLRRRTASEVALELRLFGVDSFDGVGSGHCLELSRSQFAGTANVDGDGKCQLPRLQQLTPRRVVLYAHYDTVFKNGFLQCTVLASFNKTPQFRQKRIK